MSFYLLPNLVREYIDRIFYLLQKKKPQSSIRDTKSFYESLNQERKDCLVALVHQFRDGEKVTPEAAIRQILSGTVFHGVTFTYDELYKVPSSEARERRKRQEETDLELALVLQEEENEHEHPHRRSQSVPVVAAPPLRSLSVSERRKRQEEEDLELALTLQECEVDDIGPAVPRISERERRKRQEEEDRQFALALQEVEEGDRRQRQEEEDFRLALAIQETESSGSRGRTASSTSSSSSSSRGTVSSRRAASSSSSYRVSSSDSRPGPVPDVEHMTYEQRLDFLEDVHVGLTDELIQRYPITKFHKKASEEECSICLCEFEEGQDILTLQCFHHYHPDCIKTWLKQNTKCPICQTELRGSSGARP